ncbi:MAG: tryptophan--tRNA ligase [Deltaproteobacteria bacterium]|nr:tryptophan--tRNA ligase [Deltaproteobacteria bacterium]
MLRTRHRSPAMTRILTGDTPTGRLHLGHFVGSLENRIALQHQHETFVLVANIHALTTRAADPAAIRRDTLEIVRDQLAAGIDPERATFVVQSEIPAIAELTILFAMLLPFSRVMRNPTLKAEIISKQLGDHYSFGFPLYAVGQCADILAFRADLVPVGEDQAAHIEMTREVARRFAQLYGDVFPVPEPLFGRVPRLPGLDGVEKMSKSRGNAIFLSDSADDIRKKVARITTGRQSPTDPGDPTNVLFEYARAFIRDEAHVRDLADRYARGDNLGDGEVKRQVAAAIDALVAPMRERRAQLTDARIVEILHEHTRRANAVAADTLAKAKDAMRLAF